MKTGASDWYVGLFVLVFVACMPSISLAVGFPTQSIWLSKERAIAGDTVTIFTALSNESEESIKGTLVFTVDAVKIGSKPFELNAHASKIESTEWKAEAGRHSISASIEGAALANNATGALIVTIADPPPPSQAAQTAAVVSNVFTTIVASSTPVVAGVAQTVYGVTESLRQQGVTYFENQLANSAQASSGNPANTTSTGAGRSSILGTSTQSFGSSVGAAGATASWWNGAVSLFNKTALTIMRSVALFYPLLALIFFALFYLVARRVRRNSSQ